MDLDFVGFQLLGLLGLWVLERLATMFCLASGFKYLLLGSHRFTSEEGPTC